MIDIKFGFSWLMDKLGYMPKIEVQVGKVDLDLQDTWPFPKTKPAVKKKPATKKVIVPKATTRKPKVVAKTARTKAK